MISRYLAGEYSRFFILFLSAFLIMIFIGNVFGNLSIIFEDWEGFLRFLRKTALIMPQLMEFTIPITVLLATITTLSTLNRTSELLAIRASGVGPWNLAWPLLLVTLVIAAVTYLGQNYLSVWMQRQWTETVSTENLQPIWKVGPDNKLYFFGKLPEKGKLESVTLFQWQTEPYRIVERTAIEKGEQQKASWNFQDLQQYRFSENHLKLQKLDELNMKIEEIPSLKFEKAVSPRNLPLFELRNEIENLQKEGQDVISHRVALFQKLAFPVQLFVMVFLGLSLSSSHSRKGMAAESMAISCLLGILFWILNQILLALGDAGEIHPLPASWGSIGLFAFIAWLLHFRYRV